MVVFPNAKINLGLNVVSRRNDGFHAIESVFIPIPFCDILEVVESDTSVDQLFLSGLPVAGAISDNLCMKAVSLLRKKHTIPHLSIYLHKVIPSGAGLGGGSSDGAWMLKVLNNGFKLNLTTNQLEELALELGSDCPFFIQNKPMAVSGRGEEMRKIEVDLSGHYLVLMFSGVHISTAEAYANLKPQIPDYTPAKVIGTEEIANWKNHLANDFESHAFAKYPALRLRKEGLYNFGAAYASMTGSGSVVFGIFRTAPRAAILNLIGENYRVIRL